jgi:hypothetical protein
MTTSNSIYKFKSAINGILLMGIIILLLSSCYYDNEEELYPASNSTCDTSIVTYANKIAPILQQNCTNCHSGAAPSGNIDLTTYANVFAYAQDGSLYGSVSFNPNYKSMPQGAPKMSDCNIAAIRIWVDAGAPNN